MVKKFLGIILLSFVFFSAGSIFGTGGLNTNSTLRDLDSLQTKVIEMGYTSVIDVWTVLQQVEVFVVASEENIKSTFKQFRDDQVKIAVAGLVNYKTNTIQPDIHSVDKQSVQINQPVTPVANQKTDFPPNHEPFNNSSQIDNLTTDTSMDPLIKSPQVNHKTKVQDIEVE